MRAGTSPLTDEAACLGILRELCRQSQRFRRWLCRDFRKIGVRSAFARWLRAPWDFLPRRLVDLIRGRSRRRTSTGTTHGGLPGAEVRRLIQWYETGGIDPDVMELVRHWTESPRPVALWAGLRFLSALLSDERARVASQVNRAFAFLRTDPSERRNLIGYVNWWKIHALTYILKKPRRAYRVREIRAHLLSVGLEVDSLAIRRLCKKHGIRRDSRPGRPRRSGMRSARAQVG